MNILAFSPLHPQGKNQFETRSDFMFKWYSISISISLTCSNLAVISFRINFKSKHILTEKYLKKGFLPMYQRFRKSQLQSPFFKIPIFLLLLMGLFGFFMHMIEPQTFQTTFDGIWWAFITLTTVGYGDFFPKAIGARMISMVLILIGIGYMSYLAFTVAEKTFAMHRKRREGYMKYKGSQHHIVIGWNERSRRLIQHLKENRQAIVIIDASLSHLPAEYTDFSFVRGLAYEIDTLKRAKIQAAQQVWITANNAVSEDIADKDTLITLLSVKGEAPHIFCAAEILTEAQLTNAKRAGADQIIQSNRLITNAFIECVSLPHNQ